MNLGYLVATLGVCVACTNSTHAAGPETPEVGAEASAGGHAGTEEGTGGGLGGGPEMGADIGTPQAPLIFSVMGDVPYSEADVVTLREQIKKHNAESPSRFVLHLGDIKPGSVPCEEHVYQSVAAELRALEAPTFIIPGDNEWNDCADPDTAWSLWEASFMRFDEAWEDAPTVARQASRPENFSGIENDVVFVGVNLVGGRVHDSAEWQERLMENGQWVSEQLRGAPETTFAAVVFGHATPVGAHATFIDLLRQAALEFGRPVLYMHGDGHAWFTNRPWDEGNILRVQVDQGGRRDPVQVTVSREEPDTFSFNRDPFTE